jgi:flagellar motor switch protein FliG
MGNLLKHGIDMYRQTINLKNTPEQTDQEKYIQKPLQNNQKSQGNFIKIGKIPGNETAQNKTKESKYKRAAKFLILIGSENAAGILAELDPDQVAEISKEITLTKVIKPEERDEILAEFQELFSKRNLLPYSFTGSAQGGVETARRILYAAKGPKKGEALLNKAVPKTKTNLFSFLEEFSAEQLVVLLKNESDQTAALILSRLTPKLSAETLCKLSPMRKSSIFKRMAYQSEVMPEVLEQVSAAFRDKVRHVSGGAKDVEIDGMSTLAAILKQGNYSFGDKLINELEIEDYGIAKKLKEKLYSLDDVIKTIDRPIQDKLKMMTEREIAVLLKGRKEEFIEKILSCVSIGRRKLILEESEILGPVPKRDCDAAAKDFLSWFRRAREKGEIIFFSDEDVYL